jgi:MFS family permease
MGTREAIRLPGVAPVLVAYFLVMLGFNFFYIAFPVYAATGLAWSVGQTGGFFVVMSAAMAVVQGPVLSRASKRWSDVTLIVAGGLVLGASFLLFTLQSIAAIYAGAALLALGNGLMWPSIVSVLSRRAGREHQGAVQGVAGSIGALASILGLIVGGLLFDRIGPGVFVVCAVTIMLVALLSHGLRGPTPPAPVPARATV